MDKPKLTPEQIEAWRGVLLLQIGPYALIMPAEEVQRFKDKFDKSLEADNGTPHI